MTCTPSLAISFMTSQNSSGITSKTVLVPSVLGSPALGFTTIGSEQQSAMRFTMGSILSGPNPQLTPKASTLRPSNIATVPSMPPPVRSLPESSYTQVTITGRSQTSCAAMTAALASYASLIVSMTMTSAPARAPALISSLNTSTASLKGRSPMGARSLPVGPMSIAT